MSSSSSSPPDGADGHEEVEGFLEEEAISSSDSINEQQAVPPDIDSQKLEIQQASPSKKASSEEGSVAGLATSAIFRSFPRTPLVKQPGPNSD